jgi:hypothetical protein
LSLNGCLRYQELPNDEGVDFDVPGGVEGGIPGREAEKAVQQWRYSPVVLNGIRVPFILTVTLPFSLEAPK